MRRLLISEHVGDILFTDKHCPPVIQSRYELPPFSAFSSPHSFIPLIALRPYWGTALNIFFEPIDRSILNIILIVDFLKPPLPNRYVVGT